MKRTVRSQVGGAALFLLIAAVVLGGMTWATVSTLRLSRKNVKEQHHAAVYKTLLQMDSYVGGILNREVERPCSDYRSFHTKRPVISSKVGNWESDAGLVKLPSDILEYGPRHEWIELYYQLANGVLTSPQIENEGDDWPAVPPEVNVAALRQARNSWENLETILPKPIASRRLSLGTTTSEVADASIDSKQIPQPPLLSQKNKKSVQQVRKSVVQDYMRRAQLLRNTQSRHKTQPACEDPEVAVRNFPGVIKRTLSPFASHGSEFDVNIECGEFHRPLWLIVPGSDSPKLLFQRECHVDAAIISQGFVGDWTLLRAELLSQTQEELLSELAIIFDEPVDGGVDLVSIESGQPSHVTENEAALSWLPVKLSVPFSDTKLSAIAWRSVRGVLFASWAAALCVLAVAGLGVRSLIVLTERRMQFAYAVTHELRTPLTTLQLYTDMLAAGLVPEASKQDYLLTLNRESARLSSLVEGVLEYSRLENQKVRLNPVDTDVQSVMQILSETLESRCQESGVQAVTHNGADADQTMCIDVNIVNQIAGIVIHNACRHARGSEGSQVVINLKSESGRLDLDVIDTGPGIDRSDARNIFKPFRRGRGADAAAQGGIGLGLALARDWASLLHGKLELVARHHSELGGAHFRLTIPTTARA